MASAVEPKKKSNVMYAFVCSILASMASIILGYGTHDSSHVSHRSSLYMGHKTSVHCWDSKTSG
jgi:hypothetical protein